MRGAVVPLLSCFQTPQPEFGLDFQCSYHPIGASEIIQFMPPFTGQFVLAVSIEQIMHPALQVIKQFISEQFFSDRQGH